MRVLGCAAWGVGAVGFSYTLCVGSRAGWL